LRGYAIRGVVGQGHQLQAVDSKRAANRRLDRPQESWAASRLTDILSCMYSTVGIQLIKNMDNETQDVLKGTLDMLILKALQLEPMHGWGIGERIAQLSHGVFRLQTGTLYPAMHRLVRNGWIGAEWRTTDNGRRARYYRLTASGRKQLEAERASWSRATLAVKRILNAES
jgi:PadR family transcriptional regulator PadR